MLKTYRSEIIAVLALVIAIFGFFKHGSVIDSMLDGIGTNPIENYIPAIKYNEGYYSELPVQTTSTFTSTGAITSSAGISGTTGTFSSTGSFGGLLTLNAGELHSYVNSTSTTLTSHTLVASDITNYETVIMTPNTGNLTLTFPASSTLSAFVPTAGDWAEQCWFNATSTAANTITFAAGTGIDLEIASSTSVSGAPLLTIAAGNSACFKYIRKPATASAFDIVVQMTRFVDGD